MPLSSSNHHDTTNNNDIRYIDSELSLLLIATMNAASVMQWFKMNLPRALAHPIPLLAAWLMGGLLAIVIPRGKWNAAKNEYYQYYGRWNEYNDQGGSGDNNNNQNNNYNYYQKCKWYQWSCNEYDKYNYNNNNNNNNLQLPSWYRNFGGKTEEEQRWYEETFGEDVTTESGALKFVYAWTLIMFLGILAYGVYTMWFQKRFVSGGLLVATLCFCQFTFLGMLLLVQGVISTEDRELEDSIYGWWGQTGVLIFMTNFGYMMFCLVFSFIMILMGAYQWYKEGRFHNMFRNNNTEKAEARNDSEERSEGYYNATNDWEAPPAGSSNNARPID